MTSRRTRKNPEATTLPTRRTFGRLQVKYANQEEPDIESFVRRERRQDINRRIIPQETVQEAYKYLSKHDINMLEIGGLRLKRFISLATELDKNVLDIYFDYWQERRNEEILFLKSDDHTTLAEKQLFLDIMQAHIERGFMKLSTIENVYNLFIDSLVQAEEHAKLIIANPNLFSPVMIQRALESEENVIDLWQQATRQPIFVAKFQAMIEADLEVIEESGVLVEEETIMIRPEYLINRKSVSAYEKVKITQTVSEDDGLYFGQVESMNRFMELDKLGAKRFKNTKRAQT